MISRYCALPSGREASRSRSGSRSHEPRRADRRPARRALDDVALEQAQRAGRVREAEPVAVERVVRLRQPAAVEPGQERARAPEVARRGTRSAARRAAGAARRLRVARPEPAHLVLAEDVVAGEQLVGALAGQHDLEARVADRAATGAGAAPAPSAASASRRARPPAGAARRCRRESMTTRVRLVPSSATTRSWNALSSKSASPKPSPNE